MVTTGAFYGYYDSKKELFDSPVGEQYPYLLNLYRRIIGNFTKLPPEEQKNDMQTYTAEGMCQMTESIYDHMTVFKLLLCCSDGTQCDHLIHDLAQMDLDHP